MSLILIAVTVGMFVFGLVLLPGIVFLAAPSLGTGPRTMLARILYTISALSVQGTMLYQRESGIYDFLPILEDEYGELHPYDDTVNQFVVADTEVGWSRLGKRPFGVSWQKSTDAFDVPLYEPQRSQPIADGGEETVLPVGERGGMPIATEFSAQDNRYICNVMKIMKRLEGAASGSAATQAERSALKEFGGDRSQMQMKWMIVGVLGSITMGAAMAYLVMGGL